MWTTKGEIDQALVERALARIQQFDENAEIYYESINDDTPLIVANWSTVERELPNIIDWLEYHGICTRYSDEILSCDYCGRVINTTPQYHGNLPEYMIRDGEIMCSECWLKAPETEQYINNMLEQRVVLPWQLETFRNLGFRCLEEEYACRMYATGYYPGQTDTPERALAELQEIFPDTVCDMPGDELEYIFVIHNTGQFDVHWGIYFRVTTNED